VKGEKEGRPERHFVSRGKENGSKLPRREEEEGKNGEWSLGNGVGSHHKRKTPEFLHQVMSTIRKKVKKGRLSRRKVIISSPDSP